MGSTLAIKLFLNTSSITKTVLVGAVSEKDIAFVSWGANCHALTQVTVSGA